MGLPSSYIGLASACVTALLFVAPALADDTPPPPPPPPGTPSINQYVETVPTSQGGASIGARKTRAKRLRPAIAAELRSHTDPVTKRLEEIATSSTYGAPQKNLSSPVKRDRTKPTNPTKPVAQPKAANPLSAAVSAVSDSGDSHFFWLLAALIAVTTTMVWATARRHHP